MKLLISLSMMLLFMSCHFTSHAQAGKVPVILGENVKDEQGNTINAHGAGVMYHNGKYYLYGEIKKGKTWLVAGQSWEDYRVPAGGISCYSSSDLKHWRYEGIALAPVRGDSISDIDTSRVIERPKVIYNSRTAKYVMWIHLDKKDYSYAHAGVAVSDRPEGPFHYLNSFRPNESDSRDMTVFQDDDGKAYLIHSSENNNTMHVCLLSDDYLSPTSTFSRILIGKRREAPAMFKNNGKYFLITSGCTGWAPNEANYSIAEHALGPWKEAGNPCTGPDASNTYHAQSTFVLPLQGKPGHFIFMADQWNKTDLPDSRYLWLPLTVNGDKVEIKWVNK
jgi:hypothetical protein